MRRLSSSLLVAESAILHGSLRTAQDLDVCYSRSGKNIQRLVKSLAPFHPRPRNLPLGLPFIWDEATVRNGTLLPLSTDLGSIDIMAEVLGFGDPQPSCLDPSKESWAGRPKDLEILLELQGQLEALEPD